MNGALRRRGVVVVVMAFAAVTAAVLLGTQAFGQLPVRTHDPATAAPTSAGIPITVENDTSPNPAGGGALPTTGDRIALITGIGLALVAAGAAFLLLTRRGRRPARLGPQR